MSRPEHAHMVTNPESILYIQNAFARMDVRLFFPSKLKWSGSTVHTIVQGLGNHSVFPLGPIHKEHHFTGEDAVVPY